MEIGRWFSVIVNCIILYCVVAKPFSLNEIIEAESQQKPVSQTISPKLEGPATLYSPKTSQKNKYTHQTTDVSKPSRVKPGLKIREKLNSKSIKREIGEYAKLDKNYVPLLRSLGMLLDDIIGGESGESVEVYRRDKRKRFKYYFEGDEVRCKCFSQRNNKESTSEEEAASAPETFSAEAPPPAETAAATANTAPAGDVGGLGPNKNLPLLLPRNTASTRGDNNRFSKRSSAAHHRSAERHIPGDHGNSEHNSRSGENEASAESDEEYSRSAARNRARGVGPRRGIRRDRDSGDYHDSADEAFHEDDVSKIETEHDTIDAGGGLDKLQGDNKFETRGNETQSENIISESFRGNRGNFTPDQVNSSEESVPSKEHGKESVINVTLNRSDDQRVSHGNGIPPKEDQAASTRNEKLILKKNDELERISKTHEAGKKVPLVVIFDGYSVTRHKNGENRSSEKAVTI